MNSEIETLLSRLALACGIGLLIGLERGWRTRDATPGSRTAGVRTFSLAGLLGGITGLLARSTPEGLSVAGSLLIGIAFAAFAMVFMRFTRDENRALRRFSATTAIAGLLTFMLGLYAVLGHVLVAAAAAVAATALLFLREDLHKWLQKITPPEVQSVLVLLAMTLIALPVLPDRAIGPWGGVNPREIWIIAIVLACVSFAGFVAIRLLGERRGVLVAAGFGGIVSSTAVILAHARASATLQSPARVLAAGSALATAISLLRATAIVAVLKPSMLAWAGAPLLAGVMAALAFSAVSIRGKQAFANQPQMGLPNPIGFFYVVGMALSMGVIMFAGRLVSERFGASGAMATAAITGIFDVDAMIVSMTQLTPQVLALEKAALGVLIGVATATLGKPVIGAVFGHRDYALALGALSLLCVGAGALAFLALAAIR